MSAVIVLQQMLVLFSMIAIGVFLWKKNWIDVKGQKALSKMVVNIFNPLLLIYSISGYDFEKSTMNVGQNMVFVIVYFVLLLILLHNHTSLFYPPCIMNRTIITKEKSYPDMWITNVVGL